MPSYKLYYFNAPGRAEATRLAFHIGGVPFEDIRMTGEEFGALKASGRLPFGQAPALEVDGQMIAQSKAIMRLACQAGGLYYADNLTAALAEGVVEAVQDIVEAYVKIRFGPGSDEEKAKATADWKATLPAKFADIKRQFAGVYFVGSTPTMADIAVFSLLRTIESAEAGTVAAHIPDFAPLFEALSRHPAVVKHDLRNNTKFKLTYFDVANRADTTRLCFLLGGVKFEEVRFDSSSLQAAFAQFGEMKATGVLPFGQVPILEANGKVLAQSKAISRLAAQAGDLYYEDPITAAAAESVVEAIGDAYEEAHKARWMARDPETKAAAVEKTKAVLVDRLASIKKLYAGKFFLGTKVSFADVHVFSAIRHAKDLDAAVLEAIPDWAEFYADLSARVAEYDAAHKF